jgi:hypothetical protein
MRTIPAALAAATALLPSLALASPEVPDPTDAAASVPVTTAISAFEGYRPYQDGDTPGWQEVNRAVSPSSGGAATKSKAKEAHTGPGTKETHESAHGEAHP